MESGRVNCTAQQFKITRYKGNLLTAEVVKAKEVQAHKISLLSYEDVEFLNLIILSDFFLLKKTHQLSKVCDFVSSNNEHHIHAIPYYSLKNKSFVSCQCLNS